MNVQQVPVPEKAALHMESIEVQVSTVQVSPQGMPVATPTYPSSGVGYVSNYGNPGRRGMQAKPSRTKMYVRNATRVEARFQQMIPQRNETASSVVGWVILLVISARMRWSMVT